MTAACSVFFCRTPQGVRGLKPTSLIVRARMRASHSARSAWIETQYPGWMRRCGPSHSARSAWIETKRGLGIRVRFSSRTPQGVRGLKPGPCLHVTVTTRRTPQGVRGLKLLNTLSRCKPKASHSARSAWIETARKASSSARSSSHSARSAWIET